VKKTKPAAEFVSVSKTYARPLCLRGSVRALREVSFGIEAGEVVTLLGPNRAGKTTLVKILLGLCKPTGGTVRRLGRAVAERETLARVGYMHESQAFPGYLTAVGLLQFYGTLSGVSPDALRVRVPTLLDRVGLADRALEPIRRFSKGMVQRLALAQAVLAEPELLVLDEPVEGLDLCARTVLQEMVTEHRRAGKTVLIVSHAIGEVSQVCDEVAVLVEGRLVHRGSLAPLVRDPFSGKERSLEAALRQIYGSREKAL
jgi:ABC-2 type transport system ATP-binding protein